MKYTPVYTPVLPEYTPVFWQENQMKQDELMIRKLMIRKQLLEWYMVQNWEKLCHGYMLSPLSEDLQLEV